MDLNNLVRAAILTALAIGAGYALLLIPNIELITVIIFISGLYLGPMWGLIVGASAELVFSGMNPMGSGLIFPPLFVAQILGMSLVGISGGLLRKFFFVARFSFFRMLSVGTVGFLLTFIFDSLTTLSYPLSAGFDYTRTMGLYISGMGFTLLHQVANTVIFALSIPRAMRHLKK